MTVYLDTSALVKLYVDEDGSAWTRKVVADAQSVATSMIAYVEARAAFARRRRERGLSPSDYHRTVKELEIDWERYIVLELTASVIRSAASLSESHALRAYDAVHLASAKIFKEKLGDQVAFASWDRNLEAAARREGFQLIRRI